MKANILIVDDEAAIRKALVRFLTSLGYQVEAASDGTEAIEMAKNRIYDLVISDLKMPSLSGIELIAEFKKLSAKTVFIIMTGFGTIESAVEAIKAGAFHYITKPFDLDDVALLVEKSLTYRRLQDDNAALRKQIQMNYKFDNIIGCTDKLKEVFRTVQMVADTDSNVLILGESGTGKELIARAIHYNSRRRLNPLIVVNCAAIPENLLESELFGYVKGAFTGAVSSKEGKFRMADGGTLFLDEIGDMSLSLQVKLLRVLQERRVEPLGSTRSVDVDVRIIAATHQNLEELVQQGRFREDLYYRLNVIPITVPPLRERLSDIPLLINHFIDRYALANGYKKPIVTDDIMNVFLSYKWPGNVRELENTIERLVVLRPGEKIQKTDLPEKFFQISNSFFFKTGFTIPDAGISLKSVVEDFENTLIRKALDKTGWNKNRAAHLLRLNRTTLVEKIKKKNITKPKTLCRDTESPARAN